MSDSLEYPSPGDLSGFKLKKLKKKFNPRALVSAVASAARPVAALAPRPWAGQGPQPPRPPIAPGQSASGPLPPRPWIGQGPPPPRPVVPPSPPIYAGPTTVPDSLVPGPNQNALPNQVQTRPPTYQDAAPPNGPTDADADPSAPAFYVDDEGDTYEVVPEGDPNMGDVPNVESLLYWANPANYVGRSAAWLESHYAAMVKNAKQKYAELKKHAAQFAAARRETAAQIKVATAIELKLKKAGRHNDVVRVTAFKRRLLATQADEKAIVAKLNEANEKLRIAKARGAKLDAPGLGLAPILLIPLIVAIVAYAAIAITAIYFITKFIKDVVLNRQELDAVGKGVLTQQQYVDLRNKAAETDKPPLDSALKTFAWIAGVGVLGFVALKYWEKRRG